MIYLYDSKFFAVENKLNMSRMEEEHIFLNNAHLNTGADKNLSDLTKQVLSFCGTIAGFSGKSGDPKMTQANRTSRLSCPVSCKPFAGKVFYLDLPSNRTSETLESDIKQLGGVRHCHTVLFILMCSVSTYIFPMILRKTIAHIENTA